MVLKCFRLGRPLPPLTCQLAVNALRVRIDSHGCTVLPYDSRLPPECPSSTHTRTSVHELYQSRRHAGNGFLKIRCRVSSGA
jgi:hypothetical protein